ncbi:hypothetical protein GCM10022276_12170 [Sphingomonas limnosediminicola]|uniref:Uncharacterized protein n=1 Tax=Sphingomonas limnosediminicola TaxID=940133 RepID=A0ABP7L8W6_9SPHN
MEKELPFTVPPTAPQEVESVTGALSLLVLEHCAALKLGVLSDATNNGSAFAGAASRKPSVRRDVKRIRNLQHDSTDAHYHLVYKK